MPHPLDGSSQGQIQDVKITERSWVPMNAMLLAASVFGGGGLALGMWVTVTLSGVEKDIADSAQASKLSDVQLTGRVDKLTDKVETVIKLNEENVTVDRMENWVLRFALANGDKVVVPPFKP